MASKKVVAPVLLTPQEHEFIETGVFGPYFPWFVTHQQILVFKDIDPRIINRISNNMCNFIYSIPQNIIFFQFTYYIIYFFINN